MKRGSTTLTQNTPWLKSQDDTPRSSLSTPSSVHTLQETPTQGKSITYNTKLTSLVTFRHITHFRFLYFILIHCRLSRLYMQPPNNFHILLTFYKPYFIIQQRSHEHFNLLLLLVSNFNKFG